MKPSQHIPSHKTRPRQLGGAELRLPGKSPWGRVILAGAESRSPEKSCVCPAGLSGGCAEHLTRFKGRLGA